MTFRIFYTIKQAWHFRKKLKQYMIDPSLQLANGSAITLAYLQQRDIRGLVLDYDGVLAAHCEPVPRPEILAWLQELVRAYAPHKIYILSNKPLLERMQYFAQYFPQIMFVKGQRKKPFPDGLQQIMAMSGLSGAQLMLVDDRLLTGILATIIAGTQGCWITHPYVNLKLHPVAELWIMGLRWIERSLIYK